MDQHVKTSIRQEFIEDGYLLVENTVRTGTATDDADA